MTDAFKDIEKRFDAGTVVVMDRGYVDYAWFGQLTARAVFFVTRLSGEIAV